MKRSLSRVLLGTLVVLVVFFLGGAMYFDARIKASVEADGTKLTKSDISLDACSLSLLTGSGRFVGLNVGNPTGFRDAPAIRFDAASLRLQPTSLLADKLVVSRVRIQAAEISFEGTRTVNNLRTLLENVSAVLAQKDAPAAGIAVGRRMEVGEVLITGATVNVRSPDRPGETVTLKLPDIRICDLGMDDRGITSTELSQLVLDQILKDTLTTVGETFPELREPDPEPFRTLLSPPPPELPKLLQR